MPVPLSLNPSLWLDASELSAGSLATWVDKSGYGRDATQSESNKQPSVVLGELNTLPVVRFLKPVYEMYLSGSMPIVGENCTVFMVFKPSAASGDYARFFTTRKSTEPQDYNSPYGAVPLLRVGGNSTVAIYNRGASQDNTALSYGNWHIVGSQFRSAQHQFVIDGTSGGYASSGGVTFLTDQYRIGTSWNSPSGDASVMDVAEVLVFTDLPSDADAASVNTYLYTKWFVPPTPPVVAKRVWPARVCAPHQSGVISL